MRSRREKAGLGVMPRERPSQRSAMGLDNTSGSPTLSRAARVVQQQEAADMEKAQLSRKGRVRGTTRRGRLDEAGPNRGQRAARLAFHLVAFGRLQRSEVVVHFRATQPSKT